MPGHFGGSHSHGDKTNKGSDRGHSRFSSGSGYYGGTTKTKTKTTTTNKGSDDKKVAYQTSTLGKTNAKKAAAISKKNKIKKEQDAIMRRRKGRKETILTGPLGIQETEEEALETLLGK